MPRLLRVWRPVISFSHARDVAFSASGCSSFVLNPRFITTFITIISSFRSLAIPLVIRLLLTISFSILPIHTLTGRTSRSLQVRDCMPDHICRVDSEYLNRGLLLVFDCGRAWRWRWRRVVVRDAAQLPPEAMNWVRSGQSSAC